MGNLLMFPNQVLPKREQTLFSTPSNTINFPQDMSIEEFLDIIGDINNSHDEEGYECYFYDSSKNIKMNSAIADLNNKLIIGHSPANDADVFELRDLYDCLDEAIDLDCTEVVNHTNSPFQLMVIDHKNRTIIFY